MAGEEPWIGVYDGVSPHANGGEKTPKQVFERPSLMRYFEQCDVVWFLAMVRRMADGECVDLEEIAAEYRQRHNTELESASWDSGFPSVREACKRAHEFQRKNA